MLEGDDNPNDGFRGIMGVNVQVSCCSDHPREIDWFYIERTVYGAGESDFCNGREIGSIGLEKR